MSVNTPDQPPPAFTFLDYQVRAITEADRPYIAQLIEADEYHRDNMTPDYFLNRVRGEDAWALERDGRVLLYFKTQTAVRIGMLFAQASTPDDRLENRAGLMAGLAWLEAILAGNGFREILFDTEGRELQLFAKRHLGFREAPHLLSKVVCSPMSPKASVETWEPSPQVSQEAG
jgi:hypothetical protein